ncbi:MAG: response regulator transcription factor [Hyphomonadaceae bacterium]|nr:response regulator transcription factor [Hyphomonadaceae bacterium]
MTDAHILVVDDDDRIRDLLKRFLMRAGYRVTAVSQAASARKMLQTMAFDLAIFDIMMPGEDGLSLLKAVRDEIDTPVILLTARGDPNDRIEGLRRGADDYLAKPFEPEELELRVAAILRRSARDVPAGEVYIAGMRFDPDRSELNQGDKRVRLTESETALLSRLAANPGDPVSREDLAEATGSGLDRAIDVQVTRLRRKIETDPREPVHLQTVRGVGYRLIVD